MVTPSVMRSSVENTSHGGMATPSVSAWCTPPSWPDWPADSIMKRRSGIERCCRRSDCRRRYAADAFDELLHTMAVDKKARGSTLRFVILNGLASAEILAAPEEYSAARRVRRRCKIGAASVGNRARRTEEERAKAFYPLRATTTAADSKREARAAH